MKYVPNSPLRGPAERHVVPQDLDLLAVLFDHGQGAVRAGRLDRVIQFNVGQLLAPDDELLGLGGKGIPGRQIVQILLNDDVAAAGEGRILRADEGGIARQTAPCGFSVPSTKPMRSRSSK